MVMMHVVLDNPLPPLDGENKNKMKKKTKKPRLEVENGGNSPRIGKAIVSMLSIFPCLRLS